MSSLDPPNLTVGAPGVLTAGVQAVASGATPYSASAELAAAALVHISGASSIAVEQFESGVPPNLAAASELVDQLTMSSGVSEAAIGSLYTLMDASAALALTRE